MTAPLSNDGLRNLLLALGLFVGIVMAGALVARRRPSLRELLRALGVLAALLFALSFRLLPMLGLTSELDWNWWGKLIGILACLVFVGADRRVEPARVGLRRPESGSLVPSLVALAVICLTDWAVGLALSAGGVAHPDRETLLYQATMPGLHEELFHRAIVTLLIERIIGDGGGFRLAGAEVSLPALASVVWFGLLHGIGFQSGILGADWPTVIWTGSVGFGLQWIYAHSRSVIVPIVTHNLANVGLSFIP